MITDAEQDKRGTNVPTGAILVLLLALKYNADVNRRPTSSDISVAIALPISWYDLALPLGPSRMNKNLQMEQNHLIYEIS